VRLSRSASADDFEVCCCESTTAVREGTVEGIDRMEEGGGDGDKRL